MKETIRISVRGLVEHVLNSGDLEFSFQSQGRMSAGVLAHQKLTRARPSGYAAEVFVKRVLESGDFILEISGRIDGVLTSPGRVLIEEIKTTGRDLDSLEKKQEMHWAQLMVYACFYASDHELGELDGRLIYMQQDSGETREFERHFTRLELEEWFTGLWNRYLEWASRIAGLRRIRDESLSACAFPYSVYRAGQRKMAVEVYCAVRDGTKLMVEAPTGIGKTMAALFPAARALGESHCDKIFYLTARNTQASAAESAVTELSARGARLKSLTLTAKDKICFNPGASCNPQECRYAAGYYDRLHSALDELFSTQHFNQKTLSEIAQKHTVCPFEFSLDLSLWVDVVICDYNYAFHPRVFLRRFFLEETGDYAFLLDEAHNLPDRGRDMFSAELLKSSVLNVRRTVMKLAPDVGRRLASVNKEFLKLKKEIPGPTLSRKDAPESLVPVLKRFMKIAESVLAENSGSAGWKDLLDFYFEVSAFLRVMEVYSDDYSTIYDSSGNDLRIRLFCLDPARLLSEGWNRARSAVQFSATLSPIDFFAKINGFGEEFRSIVLASPFPQENLLVLAADRVSTYYNTREKTRDELSGMIKAAVNSKPGNYIAFFPSYEYLKKVLEVIESHSPDIRVMIQKSGMNDQERADFLECFTSDNLGFLLGFAVMGGIFGEGIDLSGNRLSGSLIAGIGLPGISPERELIRDYYQERFGMGFEYSYLYPGINRVLQAAGRVIRTETDRGIVLLIDSRYSEERVIKLLPAYWRLNSVRSDREIREKLAGFWKGFS
ncbi:MAG: helicase C-terminal domain-containing protein [Candidatus Wallbacteria bacterium]|nr:helicase C-terminal domain-containing protein [Candidatus Wallbacteria bacterium]